ncbi:MAG: hypothetical protein WAP03_26240 [Methylorubrum rhodinum]
MIGRASHCGGNINFIDQRNTLDDRNLTATAIDRSDHRSELFVHLN